MKRNRRNAIVRHPGAETAGADRLTPPVIERMTGDVLARAKAKGLSAARFHIGEYELREPDYRQILHWAEALGMAPEAVMTAMAESYVEVAWFKTLPPIEFDLEDGAIVSLAWEFGRLPLAPETWEPGLLIRELGFHETWPDAGVALRPVLEQLQILRCHYTALEQIDLSGVPRLTELQCSGNYITQLDLSPVQGLTELWCSDNKLTDLDLSTVPGLRKLDCEHNQITELDLSRVPGLTALLCESNELTQLDLSPLPGLTVLDCSSNQLAELDLSPVPGLSMLHCYSNHLAELDLSPVPGLRRLVCGEGVHLYNPSADLEVSRIGW